MYMYVSMYMYVQTYVCMYRSVRHCMCHCTKYIVCQVNFNCLTFPGYFENRTYANLPNIT